MATQDINTPIQPETETIHPVQKVEVLSTPDGLTLKGNLVTVSFSSDAVLILHGAAAKGDPLPNLERVQQIFARNGISSLAIRLRGVGEGGEKSEGDYYDALIKRVDDGMCSMTFLKERTHAARLHLIGESMNGEVAALMAKELGDTLDNLVLVAPAAYPAGAEQVPFGTAFSEIIRNPDKDLTTSPAFKAVKKYNGSVIVAYDDQDPVIDTVVQDTYRKRAMQNGRVLTVEGVGHELLSNTSNPNIADMYKQVAELIKQKS